MTIFLWDASHYDWARGPMDIGAALRDGISAITHKIGEGFGFTDNRFAGFYARARAARAPLVGAYYVNHPGNPVAQADRFLALLDALAPGWRGGPFLLQVDAERWEYVSRAPNRAECKAFCDRLVQRTSGAYRPVLYAPRWVYSDTLTGVGYPLWASSYGANPALHYRAAYPGDSSSRWGRYSGQVPAILQYGSRTRIGRQGTCDANAYRGTLTQLTNLVYPKGGDDVSEADVIRALQSTAGQAAVAKALQSTAGQAATAKAVLTALHTSTPYQASGPRSRLKDADLYPPNGWADVSVRAALDYVMEAAVSPQVRVLTAAVEQLAQALAAGEQGNADRIMARIDEHAAAEAVRDALAAEHAAEVERLVREGHDGTTDARVVLRQIARLYQVYLDDDTPDAAQVDTGADTPPQVDTPPVDTPGDAEGDKSPPAEAPPADTRQGTQP